MRDEVYVTGLEAHNRLQVTWDGHACLIEVDMPDGYDPLPRLGPFVCGSSRFERETRAAVPVRQAR